MTVIDNGLITNLTANPSDTDDAALVPLNGTAAPAVTPRFVGDFFVDTSNRKLYFSVGTSSSADWEIAN